MHRHLFRWIGMLSVVFSSMALAQAEYGIHEKSLERVNAASKVAPLTTDIFGERVSLFNGATTFSNVDISIPGTLVSGTHPSPRKLDRWDGERLTLWYFAPISSRSEALQLLS